MAEGLLAKTFDELSQPDLIRCVMEGFHRTLIHYGCWFRDVEHQLGMQRALRIEAEAGIKSLGFLIGQLSLILGFEMEDGIPKPLKEMGKEQLLKLLEAVSVSWLSTDSVWFQTVEKHFGMEYAKRCNDTCWSRFSPYEAMRIKELLGLDEFPGLEGLKLALGFRMLAKINRHSTADVDKNTFVFRIDECQVQSARRRDGMEAYPCRSAGIAEYSFFASTIDSRIQTKCVGCHPDDHPEKWHCAWQFTIPSGENIAT